MRFSLNTRLAVLPLLIVALLLGLCVSFSGKTHAASALVSAPYNNVGITASTSTAAMALGNFDNAGDSYPSENLVADGFIPGTIVTEYGIDFVWPNVAAGQPDNWKAAGQTIAVNAAPGDSVLAFLGAATDTFNRGAAGTATIHYRDGSSQNFRLNFTDWLNQVFTMPDNRLPEATHAYNTPDGQVTSLWSFLYYTDVGLQAGKTAVSVTLPRTVSYGALHVFAIGTGASTAQTPAYNNASTSSDSNRAAGNFDGARNNYSAEALRTAGGSPGDRFRFNGVRFYWPNEALGAPDNYVAAGQTIAVPAANSQTKIAFLGSADFGPSLGQATITYTDATTSTIRLGFSDWTLNAGSASPSFHNLKAMTMPYRNTRTGTDPHLTYVFYAEFSITTGKTVASVTLPTMVTRGHLHVFAIGTRGTLFISSTHIHKGYTADSQRHTGSTPQAGMPNGHIRKGGHR
ncbi:MAG: hypothetical protein H0W02_03750 [Ktedonobacteraceae bacterium]|nr:hypothetical protein [Ktedonobacteraceae bacterium]